MGYPHHIQSPMHGGSSMDPKFPPNTDDYHHAHHHHYHNHNGYGHNANSMSSNMPPLQNNDYSTASNGGSGNGMHSNNTNNYNYSPTISGHFYQHSYSSQMQHVPPLPPPPAQPTNNSYSASNNNAYYGSYYGSNNGHQMMDLPLQCASAEPTNTVLGLQELGKLFHTERANTRFQRIFCSWKLLKLGLRLEKRIEEAAPAGQQLQELGMRLRCDDSGSEQVSTFEVNSSWSQFIYLFIKLILEHRFDRLRISNTCPHRTKKLLFIQISTCTSFFFCFSFSCTH